MAGIAERTNLQQPRGRREGRLPEAAAGVGQEQIDPAGIGDELALGEAARRVAQVELGDRPLEVGQVLADGARQVDVAAAALAHLVEHDAAAML